MYVTREGPTGQAEPGEVLQYQVTADGPVALNPPFVPAGAYPQSIGYDAGGQHVYVANTADGTISQYAVGIQGLLTPLSPATVSMTGAPLGATYLSVHPSGCYLYVVDTVPPYALSLAYGATPTAILQYAINADGTLQPLSPADVKVPGGLASAALAFSPNGLYAYLPVNGGAIQQFTVGTDGKLTPMQPSTVTVPESPTGLTVAPSGNVAYVISGCTACPGLVTAYNIGTGGGLVNPGPSTSVGANTLPLQIVIDPSGNYAYVLSQNTAAMASGIVSQYTLDGSGNLSPDMPASLAITVTPVQGGLALLSPDLYTVGSTGSTCYLCPGIPQDEINHFSMDSAGLLTALDITPFGGGQVTGMAILEYIPANAAH
jgi:6-phosphogluconolactonase